MYILGISALYHDSAACLLHDGRIVAAAQEERFSRIKHDPSFPSMAIAYCLQEAGITAEQITKVVFYEKPFLKFERLLETYLAFAPKGFRSFASAMTVWVKEKLFQKTLIINELKKNIDEGVDWRSRLLFSEHHLSHAASAFFPSPFEEAAILTIDGVGEWTTTSFALGKANNIGVEKEIFFPHSLGLLYSAFTYYLGFKVNSGEYKMMGLAPYGEPIYADLIRNKLISISSDGSFKLSMKYFDFATGLRMTNKNFHELFDGPPREADEELTQRHMDIAASVQAVIEDIILKLARYIAANTGQKNICLAGGVALNCVANGVLLREKIFEEIWIQPAAGDAGGAVGACLAVWHGYYGNKRRVIKSQDSMQGTYLGPSFSAEEIEDQLKNCGAIFKKYDRDEMLTIVAKELEKGKAVGWMQGRMEFGPRALGARSILASPQFEDTQKTLNLKVKFRESFRPFAPSVLVEEVSDWFDLECESPYMLIVANVLQKHLRKMTAAEKQLFGIEKLNVPRSSIPAVTHVDYSARVQTVHAETNKVYHDLISKFFDISGCPILVNTSFNVRGEPIVCTPKDAFKCFMGTGLDLLIVEDFVLKKSDQNSNLIESYENKYELD